MPVEDILASLAAVGTNENEPSLEDIMSALETEQDTMNEDEVAEIMGMMEEVLDAQMQKTEIIKQSTEQNKKRLEEEKSRRIQMEEICTRLTAVAEKAEGIVAEKAEEIGKTEHLEDKLDP
ncbi:unnamed protein product [Auanema sp. JU1783]|nr:unnamed protein product [Auanema sp. JU1783]